MKKMKTSMLPNEHWEKTMGEDVDRKLKYCEGEFAAPEELKNSVDKLTNYVKANKFSRY